MRFGQSFEKVDLLSKARYNCVNERCPKCSFFHNEVYNIAADNLVRTGARESTNTMIILIINSPKYLSWQERVTFWLHYMAAIWSGDSYQIWELSKVSDRCINMITNGEINKYWLNQPKWTFSMYISEGVCYFFSQGEQMGYPTCWKIWVKSTITKPQQNTTMRVPCTTIIS